MSTIPLLTPLAAAKGETAVPLCREVDWDFVRNRPIWRSGQPVYVTGARAVLIWAMNALHTERFAHDVFSAAYGQDLRSLVGHPYTEEVQQAEAVRIIQETLKVHPAIRDVTQVSIALEGSRLEIVCRLITSYGEVRLDACDIAV